MGSCNGRHTRVRERSGRKLGVSCGTIFRGYRRFQFNCGGAQVMLEVASIEYPFSHSLAKFYSRI